MKNVIKLLVIVLILVNVFNSIQIYNLNELLLDCSPSLINNSDTVINRVRIDSIEFVIRYQDSIISNIKINEKDDIKKANALSDTAAVELFKRLVSGS